MTNAYGRYTAQKYTTATFGGIERLHMIDFFGALLSFDCTALAGDCQPTAGLTLDFVHQLLMVWYRNLHAVSGSHSGRWESQSHLTSSNPIKINVVLCDAHKMER